MPRGRASILKQKGISCHRRAVGGPIVRDSIKRFGFSIITNPFSDWDVLITEPLNLGVFYPLTSQYKESSSIEKKVQANAHFHFFKSGFLRRFVTVRVCTPSTWQQPVEPLRVEIQVHLDPNFVIEPLKTFTRMTLFLPCSSSFKILIIWLQ